MIPPTSRYTAGVIQFLDGRCYSISRLFSINLYIHNIMPTNVEFFTQSYSLTTLHAGCKIPSSGGEGQPASRVWSKRRIPITTRRIRPEIGLFHCNLHICVHQSVYPLNIAHAERCRWGRPSMAIISDTCPLSTQY
jgi:hypothetical protein